LPLPAGGRFQDLPILRGGFEVGREAVTVINKKEVANMRRNVSGAVLMWLGGTMMVGALVALIIAILMGMSTVVTDNPGEYDDTLHILLPAALAGGAVGLLMLLYGRWQVHR
jgi:mannose/fructose/N-acetylgalactosamine-specific phosphotransferase system component IID